MASQGSIVSDLPATPPATPTYSIRSTETRGRGFFAEKDFKTGETVILEKATVIGPKQTSTLICVDCLTLLQKSELRSCANCGATLCQPCSTLDQSELLFHKDECRLFVNAG